jgi:DNA (cytosine-5)-methyltransferase 1
MTNIIANFQDDATEVMKAYYNEFDPKAASWIRQLIANGLIMDGMVDNRSILEVTPDDLKGFTRHHFFAGIGGWELALQLANWPIDRPVCTASLPCQPFSVAGAQKGKEDERHLLPHFIELVKQCNFKTIFGEQVPGAIKHGWLDDLCTEMEREKYRVGQVVLTAAGEGAPHIRQRLYWVADSINKGSQRGLSGTENRNGRPDPQLTASSRESRNQFGGGGSCRGMGNTEHDGHVTCQIGRGLSESKVKSGMLKPEGSNTTQRMGNTEHDGHATCEITASDVQPSTKRGQNGENLSGQSSGASGRADATSLSGCQGGRTEWSDPDWLYCRDEKYRPIKSSIEPLAYGLSRGVGYSSDPSEPIEPNNTQEARVMRIKGYGNAIVPQVAASFIQAFLES